MEKEIKLYTYVDGINDTPFPNEREQIVIANFKYDANRMGDAPSIEATAMHRLCLDNLWTDNVYAEFNGEKYFIMNTPSSNKSNEDERYEHQLILKSEREVLNHVYFIDAVQGDSGHDQVKSNSTKVQFMGDIEQFVERLNASLSYTKMEYTAVIDEGITSEDKMVEFEDQYVLQALQEIYNVYELPYYFDGKTIHVGYEKNAITTPFKYGYDEALLSVSKENANYKVVNRCSGYGSEENIPYYYPNNSPKGDASVKVVSGNISAGKFVIYDYEKFVANMSPTDTCSVRKEQEGDIYKFVWSVGGKDIELSDIGIRLASGVIPTGNESFTQTLEAQIPYSQYLMPPVYRETKGKERFYNAKNGTYPIPDGEGYYIFENEYSEKNPDEMIVEFSDVKPTIKGITNSQGQRIDMFLGFAYDQNDNDEVDSEGNYVHPYFFAKLRKTDGKFGFNLFDHASEDRTMQISFTSGVCGSCTFEIGVGEETSRNIVQVDDSGNLKRDENGNVLWENQSPQPRQNDTQNYEVWIALKKDDTTYTNVMPNASMDLKPSTSDTFVILGINLPQAYITAAEEKLKDSIIKYMFMNNSEKFNFSIKFSRIYFAEHPEVLELLNENSRLLVEYNGTEYTFYVDNFTYTMDGSSSLPEIEVNLVDTLTLGKNSLETAISEIKQDILSTLGGGDILAQGLKYFLRKDINDNANGQITFNKGLLSDNLASKNFTSGPFGTGFIIKRDPKTGKSYIEADEIYIRLKAYFDTLEIKHLSHVGGRVVLSPASMECTRVEVISTDMDALYDYNGDPLYDVESSRLYALKTGTRSVSVYRCYFKQSDDTKEIVNEFAVDDLAQCREFNVKENVSQNVSNQYYWRRVVAVGKDYIDLSADDCDAGSMEPKAGDTIVTIGNKTNAARQHVVFLSSYDDDAPCIKLYSGINDYSMLNKEITVISPNADKNVFTGKVVIKPGSSGFGNFTDAPDINKIESEIEQAKNDASAAIAAATEVQQDIFDLNAYVDGAFSDGIISQTEAKAIEKYINTVRTSYLSAEEEYNELYNNSYLEGFPKTNLKAKYDELSTATGELLASITLAISDGKTTEEEKEDVDTCFTAFNNAYGAFTRAIESANKAIQDKLKSYSDNAQMSADEAKADASKAIEGANQAKTDVTNLNNYVDGAFADGIISQSEAMAIEKYINTVNSTKQEVDATYTKLYNNTYLTGTAKDGLSKSKTAFDTATSNLIKSINTAISDGKTTQIEKQDVDSKFSAFNTAYANFATAIETANKAIQDEIKKQASDEAKENALTEINKVSEEYKEDIAEKLGYGNYAELEAFASRGETIISGGSINTKLINATLIVTSALIANAIKSKELNVNDNFIVKTDGSVDVQGVTRSKGINTELALSDGYMRIMYNGSEVLRLSVNESTGLPELNMSYQGKTLYATPSVLSFGIGNGKFLRLDPAEIGEGVIMKDENNRLYLANQSYQYITVYLRVSPEGAGKTSPFNGVALRLVGSSETISAIANEGYEFERWSDGGAQAHTVSWTDGSSITAYFVKKEVTLYTLRSSVFGIPKNGSIIPEGVNTYKEGQVVRVTATPKEGYIFNGWVPTSWGDNNPLDITMEGETEKFVIATFKEVVVNTGDELLPSWSNSLYWDNNSDAKIIVGSSSVSIRNNSNTLGQPTGFAILGAGYMQNKLISGKTYRLTFECKPLEYVDGANSIIAGLGKLSKSDNNIDADISNQVIYGDKVYSGKWNNFTLDMIMLKNSDSEYGVFFYGIVGGIEVRNISLKELLYYGNN